MKKGFIRGLSLILSVLLIGTMFLTSVLAAPDLWNGTDVASNFGGGNGSETDPYIISTAAQLAYLAKQTNEKIDYTGMYFKQSEDINLNEKNWTPIGGATGSFKGNYDGDGHTISGLKCDTIALDGDAKIYAGLFGQVTGSVIKNLTVSGSLVRSNKFAAPIVGYAKNLTKIINCTTNIEKIDGACAGGIVGRCDFSEFTSEEKNLIVGCTSNSNIITTGNVSADGNTGRSYTYCGGIVGVSAATTVAYCVNNGTLDLIPLLNKAYAIWSGGIVGANGSSLFKSDIYFCTNNGTIQSYTSYDVSSILEQASGTTVNKYENIIRIGGISGHFTNKVENNIIAGCLNTGKVVIYKSSAINAEQLVTEDSTTQRAAGIIALANKKCISTANYSTMEPGVGVDSLSAGLETTIKLVTADGIKADGGLALLERGNTFDSFIEMLVSHSLSNSFYTQNEIKAMEQSIGNVAMQEYMSAFVKEEFSENKAVINSIWQVKNDSAPVISDVSKAIEAAEFIAEIQNCVDEKLQKIESGENDDTVDTGSTGDTENTEENKNTGDNGDNKSDETTLSQKKNPSETVSNTPGNKGCSSLIATATLSLFAIVIAGVTVISVKRRED